MKSRKEIEEKIRNMRGTGNIEWIKFQSGYVDALLWVLGLEYEQPRFDLKDVLKRKEP